MNELIPTRNAVINGETVNAVNARELHVFLESKQDFSDWIKSRIKKYGFVENVDFAVHKIMDGGNHGRFTPTDYIITLDMAKELAMVENNERGKQARQYFITVEKNARKFSEAVANQVNAIIPIIRENERLRFEYNFAKNFLPHGNPGDLNDKGEAKTRFRRGYYCAGNGRSVTALIERDNQPGLFDEIELKQIDGEVR